jgi:hypothetical protein
MNFVLGTLTGLVAVFALVGVGVMVGAFRSARAERRSLGPAAADTPGTTTLRARIDRYVGPVEPHMALLNPPGRVAAEFFTALCGFPGMGWMLSGSVFAGLVLICVVPAFVWGIYPALLVLTGQMDSGPFIAVQYLPGLAVGSSALLAYREIQLARERRRKAEPPRASE